MLPYIKFIVYFYINLIDYKVSTRSNTMWGDKIMKKVNLTEDQLKLIKSEQTKILKEQFQGHFDSVLDEAILEVINEQDFEKDEDLNTDVIDQEEEMVQDPQQDQEDQEQELNGETSDIIDFLKGEHRDEFRGQIVRKLSKKVKGQSVNFTFIGDFDKDYQEMQAQIQDDLSREKYRLFSNSIIVFQYINRKSKQKEQVWFMPVKIKP